MAEVEVVSYGEVWATPFDTNAVASAGAPFEIVPGITSFAFEHTPSNSYRLAWTNAAIGRDTNSLVSAAIELFRNGDVAVATNGVAARFPRVLPFPHDGFGQDAEWVAANFTNATEILAAGYPEWVDAQVGHGLKNGLYKLTVTVPDDPPETSWIRVGGLSVAVTNAGDYVFLLEKGADYDIGTVPYLENVAYSAVDDIAPPLRGSYGWDAGEWTEDGGFGMVPQTPFAFGRVWWMPLFFGSPNVAHIGPDDGPVLFSACFADCLSAPAATYQWTASEGISVVSPNSQSTEVYIASMPSWAEAEMSVTALVGGHELNSRLGRLTYGTNDTPQVHLSLNVPHMLLLNSNETSAAKVVQARWAFSSDIPTNGTIRVSCAPGRVSAPDFLGEWQLSGDDGTSVAASVEGVGASAAVGDAVFRMEFVCGGMTNAVERAVTVVRVGDVLVPSAPADGLVVLTNTPVAMRLDCKPANSGDFLSSLWQVRRLKSDGTHEPWTTVAAVPGVETVFTPAAGGIYQVRAVASAPFGGEDERFYRWEVDEDQTTGFRRRGDLKSFGVCDEQWQIDLRSCAKAFIGSTAYLEMTYVPAQYGFSRYPSGDNYYKCNVFVAHRAVEAGLSVPSTHGIIRTYPPSANEWFDVSYQIDGWLPISADQVPQPGYISASHGEVYGHVGIVDFDGMGLSAGMKNVNRNMSACAQGTTIREYRRQQ